MRRDAINHHHHGLRWSFPASRSDIKHHANAETMSNPPRLLDFHIIVFTLQKDIFKNVAKCKNTDQAIVFVNYHKSVDTRLADGIKDRVETVLHRTGVNAREILKGTLISSPYFRMYMSSHLNASAKLHQQ